MKALSISAIVPVHNGAGHLADALRSIRAQTCPVAEVIVVDDGSTDDPASLVRAVDPDAIVIRQPRAGPAAARNKGAERSCGDWLGFLDHDDVWPPDRNRRLLDGLAGQPEAGMICGRIRIEAAPGVPVDERLRRADNTCIPFLFPTALIRRGVWLDAGGMSPDHDRAEDLDLYLRLLDAGVHVAEIDATTLIYRQHGGNRSRFAHLSAQAMLATMRAATVRRRNRAG